MIKIDKELETITIPFEEYKELLIIKGKYEELKERCKPTLVNNSITYRNTRYPFKVTRKGISAPE